MKGVVVRQSQYEARKKVMDFIILAAIAILSSVALLWGITAIYELLQ